MTKRFVLTICAALVICCAVFSSALAATLSPTLNASLPSLADTATVGTVIVSFNTADGLRAAHLDVLRGVGITGGKTFKNLGMVAVTATAGQVRALASNSAVRSIWSNDRLYYYDYQARTLAGVDRVRSDSAMTKVNGGMPVTGNGDFSVLVIDSGIDATHPDLKFGQKVIQNVQVLTSTDTVEEGFTPLVVVENVPNTDQTVGHGTHCAGIIGGTGQASGGRYAGVAPGAKVIGAGLGAGVFVLNAVGAWEWGLANQDLYKIRVVSNSYGSFAKFDPDNPINIASHTAYERNITVVFAAGNSGPGKNTYNRYAKAPWVIGVAAGTKEGGLAGFSSRGIPRAERLGDDDPLNDYDAPTITAPGTGREFESDAGKFTSDYISTRSTSNLVANGQTADTEIPIGYIPYYTQISGTSMATPFVAGVVALMLDADPTLTPDEVKSILTDTASRMPGYEDYQVGAGYVNVYGAVDKVFNRSRAYGSYNNISFNAQYTVSGPTPAAFHIDYNPAALPGPGSVNARTFTVEPNINVLDVFATIDTAAQTGDGNVLALLLTDPNGVKYASSFPLPVLDAPSREVVVKNPAAGQWVLEVRGARGLAAAPGVSIPTSGAAAPGPVDGTITQQRFALAPVADIQEHAAKDEIEKALKARLIDTFADGTFRPDDQVTREDLARTLVLNTPLRQSLGTAPKFTDVSGSLAAIAEAVTAKGSTLRDWDFTPQGMMSFSGTTFNPAGAVNRLDVAVAFIRALGLDTEARGKANTVVTYGGTALSDNSEIPGPLRGYVQLALDRGLFEAYPAEVKQTATGQFVALPGPRFEPGTVMTRAALAGKLNIFSQRFTAGN